MISQREKIDRTHNPLWYLAFINSVPLTLDEERKLFEKLKSNRKGDRSTPKEVKEIRKRIINANQGLVIKHAKQNSGRSLDLGDLIQEGNIGLMKAVDKFDPSRGYRFSTYAIWWIRNAIQRAIMDKSRTIRIPVHKQEKLKKFNRAVRKLTGDPGRQPTLEEISQESGLSVKEVIKTSTIPHQPLSLNQEIGNNPDNSQLYSCIEDRTLLSPEEEASRNSKLAHLREVLNGLEERDKNIMKLRLFRGKTLKEVGDKHGLSRERIRQIQNKFAKKLAQRLKQKEVSPPH
jgi:RNA polymerase primary sigma factor